MRGVFSFLRTDNMEYHDLANLFPMMTDGERAALVDDMRQNGYDSTAPIVMHEGKILDGRNRWEASKHLGIDAPTIDYDGDDPLGYVIRHNLTRRHLNESQRAVVAGRLANLNNGQRADKVEKASSANLPSLPPVTQTKAAEMLNVSDRTIRTVKAVERQAPELIKEIENGNLNAHQAQQISKLAEPQRAVVLPRVVGGESVKNAVREAKRDTKQAEKETAARAVFSESGAKVEVSLGDYWKLGNHLLYCGDTSSNEWLKGKRATLAFADPPYGAGVETFKDDVFFWEHDYLIDYADVVCVTPGIVSIFEFAQKTAMPYKWSIAAWITNGMTRGALGFGNWIYTAVFSHGSIYKTAQDHYRVTISTSETERTSHKGRKPSDYMVEMLRLFTDEGDAVIDPFVGSGTTLLVCETMGRHCIAGEIIPEFCGDIIAQWQELTGETAIKL